MEMVSKAESLLLSTSVQFCRAHRLISAILCSPPLLSDPHVSPSLCRAPAGHSEAEEHTAFIAGRASLLRLEIEMHSIRYENIYLLVQGVSYVSPREPQAKDAGTGTEYIADVFLFLQIKREKRLRNAGCQAGAERMAVD